MELISDRIKKIIQTEGLTKTKFAEKIGFSVSFATNIANGQKIPSERTIKDICKTFKISESWLKTGQGEMYEDLTISENLAAYCGEVLSSSSDDFRLHLLTLLSTLNEEQLRVLQEIAENFAKIKENRPND